METPLDYASSTLNRRAAARRRGIVPWLSLAGTVFVWIIPLGILGGVISLLTLPIIAPFVEALLIYVVYRTVMNLRQRNGQTIVDYVELAVRLNLPLPAFLRAAERSETGARRRQIGRVRARLEAGASLADALAEAQDVSDDVVARIQASETLGQVRPALAKSIEEERRANDQWADTPDPIVYRIYVVFMLFAMSGLIIGLMIFVVPRFKEIILDFKTTLPPLTEFVIRVSTFCTQDAWPLTSLVILAIVGIILLFLSLWATRVFLPFLPLPDFRRPIDWVAWRLPIAGRMERDRGMAETCALLAAATRAGISLPAAALQAMSLPVNGAFRARLERFYHCLLGGAAPADAAREAGLPDLMAGLLAPLSRRAPEADLFTFLERYYRNHFSRMQVTLRGAFGPLMVLLLASVVGTAVTALFLPLVRLIATVTGSPEGGPL